MALKLCSRTAAIPPSATLAISARAGALRADGFPVIDFGAGEPDFATPAHICDAAKRALDMGLTRYTAAAGDIALRRAICRKLLRDNGLTYAPEEIVVSGGAKHSLYNICAALIDPGDEVLLPTPCWVSYAEMVRLCGGVPVIVPGKAEDDFIVTADMLRRRVTQRTKALILNSPGNPCGSVWQREELKEIAELAVEKEFYVISDEIYEKLVYDGAEHVSIAALGEAIKRQTIVVNGVSKAFAMTGWRIGYAAGPRDVMRAVANFQSHTASAPNTMAQHAAIAALDGGDACVIAMREEFDARRRMMAEAVNAIDGVSCRTPQGAFYVMMNIAPLLGRRMGKDVIGCTEIFARMLLEHEYVAVVPGEAFGDTQHVRLSYATSRENIDEGMRRIRRFVSVLK